MSKTNRAARITKTQKVIRKHYKPVAGTERPVLEHLLYACCVENATQEAADEAFARLQESYFDWNEVRVTTVTELAEVMARLPDAAKAAKRLKTTLQAVFEKHYSFDLEFLKKQNLGKSIKDIAAFPGVTPFAASFVAQHGFGGHSIPLSDGTLGAMVAVGVATEADASKHKVPGLERAVPKSKGVEFASLLHQLGVDYYNSPFSPRLRAIILEIAPDAKDRLPKRSTKKAPAKTAATPAQKTAKAKPTAEKKKVARKAAPKKKKTARPAKKKTATKSLSKRKPR